MTANEFFVRGEADTSDVWILRDSEESVVPNGRELSTNGLQVRCRRESRNEGGSRSV